MKILSFESTCDETAVAVVEDGRKILTDQIFSQAKLHAVYGGVVPEIASRCHVESISILAQKAIDAAGITRADIDAVAVSYAPGLIGAVLVGVNFAKSCAYALGVPRSCSARRSTGTRQDNPRDDHRRRDGYVFAPDLRTRDSTRR